MSREEQDTIIKYTKLANKYGDSYLSLNWGSREGQHLRFEILSEIDNLNGARILDVGCGLGDFAGYLSNSGISADYTGIDITEDLIEIAKKKHPDFNFLVGSISDESIFSNNQFDYVFASGIFATYANNGDEWLKKCLARMWDIAKKGIAFNTLSAWASDKEEGEYYAEPVWLLNVARELSPWVIMRHDYHPRDVALYITRHKRS